MVFWRNLDVSSRILLASETSKSRSEELHGEDLVGRAEVEDDCLVGIFVMSMTGSLAFVDFFFGLALVLAVAVAALDLLSCEGAGLGGFIDGSFSFPLMNLLKTFVLVESNSATEEEKVGNGGDCVRLIHNSIFFSFALRPIHL